MDLFITGGNFNVLNAILTATFLPADTALARTEILITAVTETVHFAPVYFE
jgi:hypothetical protein